MNPIQYVNKYAFRSAPGAYGLCLMLYLASGAQTFVSLKFTEYNINTAYGLLTGEIRLEEALKGILFYAVLTLFFMFLSCMQTLAENKLLLKLSYRYEKELNGALASAAWEKYESHGDALKIQDCRTKSLDVMKRITSGSMRLMGFLPLLFVYGYFLLRINPAILAVYLILLFGFQGIGNRLKYKTRHYWAEIKPYTQKQSYFFKMCGDKISHQEFEFNRLYDYVAENWERAYDEEIRRRMKIHKSIELGMKSAQILFYLPRFIMLTYIVYGILEGFFQVGFFVMANTLMANISNTLGEIQEIRTLFQSQGSFVESFQEVMTWEEENGGTESGRVRMQDVSYRYPQSEKPALDHLNLNIGERERLAIVGENGSGKTTCVNLLLSLIRPSSGIAETCGMEKFSVILQDFAQYQATVMENIEFGYPKKEWSEEEIWELLEKVGLKEEIKRLPQGIHTQLGQLDHGVELSKGQWQRLAVARLLANPEARIWILDEPTAYLDPLSEIEIYDLIYDCAGDRTVFFISHRLGFAKKADRILVFQKGRIAEEGAHDELMREGGLYAQMYQLQKEWYS